MSKHYKIAVIPGDGTGPEVVAEGIKALKALSKRCGLKFEFKEFHLGGEQYLKNGTLLPEDVVEELKGTDAIYLGAIGHPEVKPGILERDILLKMRFALDLYINLRPVVLILECIRPSRTKARRILTSWLSGRTRKACTRGEEASSRRERRMRWPSRSP